MVHFYMLTLKSMNLVISRLFVEYGKEMHGKFGLHLQQEYFPSFKQSHSCFVALSLPWTSHFYRLRGRNLLKPACCTIIMFSPFNQCYTSLHRRRRRRLKKMDANQLSESQK